METLFIFALIFVPMGWLMWRMLRFTRDTIGTHSPLKVQRIYYTSLRSFFPFLDYVFVVTMLIFGAVILYAVIFARFSMSDPWLARISMLLVTPLPLGIASLVTIVDINHYTYVGHVTITTFPDWHEMEITVNGQVRRLKDGDIERIEIIHNNSKLQLGFAQYHLRDGDWFVLSLRTKGIWVIQEYFKNVPVEYTISAYPLIKSKHVATESL